jgi:Fe-S cluster assembly iron-binding protein IscA
MALDEPRQSDTVIDRGTYRFLLDSQMQTLINDSGGLRIDYVESASQRGYVVKLGNAPDGCGGSCSC